MAASLCIVPSLYFSSQPYKRFEIKAAGNTYGTFFRATTFGESHGAGIGCVVDGCPPRLPLSEADIQLELDRRRPGQNKGTTPREEADACQISSGITDGLTTGSPIKVEVFNTNTRGSDYSEMSKVYRPSHADATYDFKYGLRSIEGGGRSSARETIGRVAAGAIAKKILKQFSGTEVLAYTSRVHKVVLPEDLVDYDTLTLDQVESNIVRCPNPEYAEKMIAAIDAVRESGDSAGGIVTCIVRNVPRGGISNGEIISMKIAFKPTPTINKKQKTVTRDKHETELIFPGRQEPCVAPRAVPVVEAMVAMVLVDQLMAQYAQCMLFPINPTLQEPMSTLKTKLDHAVLN
ncbi:chorismate synthase 2, chloroplastic-like isoform X2 [Capsicum annuum]|uniref:chorismate synthase 2, chloroplastic-like isoform X2 n=1 Tax=Capsicum annuum TaxID=4072 RepID=UPI001FB06A6B|nr:chorismate synthase 2, chloroplastic-like isoform X2 [Capsicum annuum]